MSDPIMDDGVQDVLMSLVDRAARPQLLHEQIAQVLKGQGELSRMINQLHDYYQAIDTRLCDLEVQQHELLNLLATRRRRKKALLP